LSAQRSQARQTVDVGQDRVAADPYVVAQLGETRQAIHVGQSRVGDAQVTSDHLATSDASQVPVRVGGIDGVVPRAGDRACRVVVIACVIVVAFDVDFSVAASDEQQAQAYRSDKRRYVNSGASDA
jgi:hypothetical protein